MPKTLVIYPSKNKKASDSKRKRNPNPRKVKIEAATLQDIKKGVYDDFIANRIVQNESIVYPKKEAEVFKTKVEQQQAMVLAAGMLYDFRNPETVEEKLERLQKEKKNFDKDDLVKAFGIDPEEYGDDYTSVYKKDHLYKYHDAVRVNGSYSGAVERTMDFVTGIDYSHTVIDTNGSYPNSAVESKALVKLNNNYLLFSIKNELDQIDITVGLRKVILAHFINRRTYGRACNLVFYDEITHLPVAIDPLNSIGLGRVFYVKKGSQILGVEYEYLDAPDNLLASSRIIYSANRDYGQSPGSYRYGYSDVEYFQPLVETNFITDAFDLKEINRNNYLPKKIYRVLTEDQRVVTEVRKAIESGNQVVTRHQVEVKDVTSASESKTLIEQRSANEDKITQESGMPNVLMGRKTSDTFATTTQLMQMFNETTARKWRMEIREVFEPQYYMRNVKQIIKFRLEFLRKIKSKYQDGKRNSDTILQEMLPLTQREELTDGEEEELAYLRYEYSLQKDREKWEQYREEFVSQRLQLVEDQINDNVNIPFDQTQPLYDKISKTVKSKGTFNLDTLDTETTSPTTTDQPSDLNTESKWSNYEMPSPSTIDFEIAELEKLIVLEPPEYDFKMKMVFKNASLITDLEKATMLTGLLTAGVIPKEKVLSEMEYDDLIEQEKMKQGLDKTLTRLGKRYAMAMSPEDQEAQRQMDMVDATTNQPIKGSLNNRFNSQNRKPTVQTDQTSTP